MVNDYGETSSEELCPQAHMTQIIQNGMSPKSGHTQMGAVCNLVGHYVLINHTKVPVLLSLGLLTLAKAICLSRKVERLSEDQTRRPAEQLGSRTLA
jgi:hypothetical protein